MNAGEGDVTDVLGRAGGGVNSSGGAVGGCGVEVVSDGTSVLEAESAVGNGSRGSLLSSLW